MKIFVLGTRSAIAESDEKATVENDSGLFL